MKRKRERTTLAALAGAAMTGMVSASGACVLPGYEVTTSSGTSSTTTSAGGGGIGGTTSSQGGTGATGATGGTATTTSTGGGGTGGTGGGDVMTRVEWANAYGSDGYDAAATIARNPLDHRLWVGGEIGGPVDFVVKTLSPTSAPDGYALTLDPAGAPIVAASYGDPANGSFAQSVEAIAIGPDGSRAVAVQFTGTVKNPGLDEAYGSWGGKDILVVKYAPAGAFQWASHLGDTGDMDVAGMAIDPSSGTVLVAGTFAGTGRFGANALGANVKDADSIGGLDVFVTKLAGGNDGAVWVKTFGSANDDVAAGFAFEPGIPVGSASLFVTGHVTGDIATALDGVTAPSYGGTSDVFVLGLSTDSSVKWAQTFGDGEVQTGLGIALGPLGMLVVAGDFTGTVYMPSALQDAGVQGIEDLFVAKLARATGAAVSAVSIPDVDPHYRLAVAPDTDPELGFWVAGTTGPAADIDAFVRRFDGQLALQWTELFQGSGTQRVDAAVAGPGGDLFVVGTFAGNLTYGAQILAMPGMAEDLFVMKLHP